VIRKIISSGKDGVEQAALDVAIKLEISYYGWIPVNRKNILPEKYELKAISSKDGSVCIEKNIREAHGTLFLYKKVVDTQFDRTKKLAEGYQKPFLSIDLGRVSKFESALHICQWIVEHRIEILHITGENVKKESHIYKDTMDILESVVYLGYTQYDKPLTIEFPLTDKKLPKTINEAVDLLISELPLKDKVVVANMSIGELGSLNITLGRYVRDSFGLWTGNLPLAESCREHAKDKDLQVENVSIVILQALWERLRLSHRLRIVR